MRTLRYQRIKLLGMFFSVFLLSLAVLQQGSRAQAISNNNSNIPDSIVNFMENNNCGKNYAQFAWLSPVLDPKGNTINVPYGTDSVNMWFNTLSAVCNDNISGGNIRARDKIVTRSRVTSATSSNGNLTNLVGNYTDETYQTAYNYNARYIKDWDSPSGGNIAERIGFSVSGLSSLAPGVHTVTVTAGIRMIHWTNQTNGSDQFQCVITPYQRASGIDDGTCQSSSQSFSIQINVGTRPDTPPNGNAIITCSGLEVSGAEDPDVPSQAVQFDVYRSGGGIVGGGTANAVSNDGLYDLLGNGVLPGTPISVGFYNYRPDGVNDNSGGLVRWVTVTDWPSCPPVESEVTPVAQVLFDDDENPASVELTTRVERVRGASFAHNVTREYYVERGANKTVVAVANFEAPGLASNPITSSGNGPWGPENLKVLTPITKLSLQVGDKVCAIATVSPAAVRVNYNGTVDILDATKTVTPPACAIYQNKPYLSVYGADVSAGGDFKGNGPCNKSADIKTYSRSGFQGSGVQLAAFALGTISGFNSARLRTSDPQPPKGLTFANNGTNRGNFGVDHCITDYFADAAILPEDNTTTAIDLSTLNSGSYHLKNSSTITLTGTIPAGRRVSLYVDGDVRITDNISYASTSWTSFSDIPSFHLYVKGNVFVEADVEELTGMFVAQPTGAADGVITTCVNAGTNTAPAANQLLSTCNKRLTIYGSFVARSVRFFRSNGSLRDATSIEQQASTSGAAEVFSFSPDNYFVAPEPVPGSPDDTTGYDSFTGLPPIL